MYNDAVSIYRNRGIRHLSKRIVKFLCWRLKTAIESVSDVYWDWQGGEQMFSVGRHSATFEASTEVGGDTIRRHFDSERDLLVKLMDELNSDDVFYDLGANLGLHSNFAGQVCENVVAFEPYPPNFRQLKQNLSEIPADTDLFQFALSESAGEVQFPSEEGVGQGGGEIGSGSETVRTVRGDDLIVEENLPKPDVVKIDVEGAEGMAVRGMKDTLADVRTVFCEIHLPSDDPKASSVSNYGDSPMGLLTEFESLGFELNFITNRGEEIQIVAERET